MLDGDREVHASHVYDHLWPVSLRRRSPFTYRNDYGRRLDRHRRGGGVAHVNRRDITVILQRRVAKRNRRKGARSPDQSRTKSIGSLFTAVIYWSFPLGTLLELSGLPSRITRLLVGYFMLTGFLFASFLPYSVLWLLSVFSARHSHLVLYANTQHTSLIILFYTNFGCRPILHCRIITSALVVKFNSVSP